MTTNGMLLTPQVASYLEQEGFAAVLSLDGRPGVHDRMRITPAAAAATAPLPRIRDYALAERAAAAIFAAPTPALILILPRRGAPLRPGLRHISMEPLVASERTMPCVKKTCPAWKKNMSV